MNRYSRTPRRRTFVRRRRSNINSGANFRGFRRSPWARKGKEVRLDITTPTAGEGNRTLLVDHPGTADEDPTMLSLRKMNIMWVFQYDAGTADDIKGWSGVVEVSLGMAEDSAAFLKVQMEDDGQGLIKKLCPILNGAGSCHIWLPQGYNLGGSETPAGAPLAVYTGYILQTQSVTGPANSNLRAQLCARWYGRGYNTRY